MQPFGHRQARNASRINTGTGTSSHPGQASPETKRQASSASSKGRLFTASRCDRSTARAATLYSVGTNNAHGLPSTNEDKRHAALLLLKDEEWTTWTDGAIAKTCVASRQYVNVLRGVTCSQTTSEDRASREYIIKHGTVATMRTENLGKVSTDGRRYTPKHGTDTFEHRSVTSSESGKKLNISKQF